MNISDLRQWILHRLARHGYIGRRHTAFDNIPKGAPKHLWKEIKQVARELVREGFLVHKPTGYGLHVSINPKRMEEVNKAIAGITEKILDSKLSPENH